MAVVGIAAVSLATGALAAIGLKHYQDGYARVTVARNASDGPAAEAAYSTCKPAAMWNVQFVDRDPLILEQRVCPPDFQAGKVSRAPLDSNQQHEVLLIERKRGRNVELLDTFFSNANFRRIEPGVLNGVQAVLWSAMEPCGSCHSGPEGVLLWDASADHFRWNEDWREDNQSVFAKAMPADAYLDEAESLFWGETLDALFLRADVHDGDAHCCPSGGKLMGEAYADHGKLLFRSVGLSPQVTVKGN